jgi:hypothetical protein
MELIDMELIDNESRKYKFIKMNKLITSDSGEPIIKENIFANYDFSQTLQLILLRDKYSKIREYFTKKYPNDLSKPVGSFLMTLKQNGNLDYLKFLKPFGDKFYCEFEITNQSYLKDIGLFCYTYDKENDDKENPLYIGGTSKSFESYINSTSGIGQTSSVNCYKHGQGTNVHLNFRMANSLKLKNRATEGKKLNIWICPLNEYSSPQISDASKSLKEVYTPIWNG